MKIVIAMLVGCLVIVGLVVGGALLFYHEHNSPAAKEERAAKAAAQERAQAWIIKQLKNVPGITHVSVDYANDFEESGGTLNIGAWMGLPSPS